MSRQAISGQSAFVAHWERTLKNVILLIIDTFRAFASRRTTAIEGFHTGSFPTTIPPRTDVATGRLDWPVPVDCRSAERQPRRRVEQPAPTA